jgi:AraC-like DNA-binding protein
MMKKPLTLSVRAMKPVIAGFHALGHDVDTLLDAAGVSRVMLADLERQLPAGAMQSVWTRALEMTRDDCLGLHLAMAAPIDAFDVHAYAMLSSPTLRDAFARACRYQRLVNEGTTLTLHESAGEATLRHALANGNAVPRQPAEFLAATWVRIGRLVTGTEWHPSGVFFAHERPRDLSEHLSIFGSALHFSVGRTALQVTTDTLSLSNARADATLAGLLDRYTLSLLDRHPAVTTMSGQVHAWLVESHGAGAPTTSRAAKALAVSERTMHRKMADEGTTFRVVLDRFRHETAVTLLNARRHTIADVAFLLGYSELSAFYRAFRRWTGRSPASLREESSSA